MRLLVLFFITIQYAYGNCSIETFDKFLVLNQEAVASKALAIKKTNCNDEIITKFLKLITNGNGYIRSHLIGDDVVLSPSKVRVQQVNTLVQSQVFHRADWIWQNETRLHTDSIFAIDKNESINLSCTNCSSPGNKTLKITISNPISNAQKIYWTTGKVLIKSKALVANQNITDLSKPISPSMFNIQEVLTENPENFYTNQSQLVFYKLVRRLKEGESLLFTTMTPSRLVSPGEKTKVSLSEGLLKLEIMATAIQGGKLGDTISLRNTRSNKTIVGKIVDYNKVIIDL